MSCFKKIDGTKGVGRKNTKENAVRNKILILIVSIYVHKALHISSIRHFFLVIDIIHLSKERFLWHPIYSIDLKVTPLTNIIENSLLHVVVMLSS